MRGRWPRRCATRAVTDLGEALDRGGPELQHDGGRDVITGRAIGFYRASSRCTTTNVSVGVFLRWIAFATS